MQVLSEFGDHNIARIDLPNNVDGDGQNITQARLEVQYGGSTGVSGVRPRFGERRIT